MRKSDLRRVYLGKRAALNIHEHSQQSIAIAERFFRETDLRNIGALHCFISILHTGEVETKPVFEKLWRDFPQIDTFAPRVNEQTKEIESIRLSSGTSLKESKWNILEPPGDEKVAPWIIDLVIVPLLCFDAEGHRVGYGKGFYDRFLKKCRSDCVRVGVSFFPPIDRIDDVREDDVPLDLCVTPERVHRWLRP